MIDEKPVQDFYPQNMSYCYGCGRLNEAGLHIQSFWTGTEGLCRFTPRPEHMAIPGYVYGGLIASLIDCHGTGTAAAAAYHHEQRSLDSLPANRFLTASLQVDYLLPTPLGIELELRARPIEVKTRPDKKGVERVRKVTLEVDLLAQGKICARGHIVTVQAPAHLISSATNPPAHSAPHV
jgi:acyl-coenzyme A thioesterase PaaI-like protein